MAFSSVASVRAQLVLYVDADAPGLNDGSIWEDAYQDLQAALDEAEASGVGGVEIRVADGTYRPSRRTDPDDPRSVTFQLLSGLALRGGFAGWGTVNPDERDIAHHETILSGDLDGNDGPDFANYEENAFHVVTTSGTDASTLLDGLTITGGNADGFPNPRSYGGGVLNYGGSPMIRDCTFFRNRAAPSTGSILAQEFNVAVNPSALGSAMYSQYPGEPRFIRCEFVENAAPEAGGALFINGTNTASLTGCTFAGNTGGIGAALAINDAQVTLEDCTFVENITEYNGGALVAFGELAMSRCRFDGNQAGWSGGAIFSNGRLTLRDCEFTRNTAEYIGGAVYSRDYEITIDNCLFAENIANVAAGVYIDAPIAGRITGCIFNRNRASGDAGGMEIRFGSPPFVVKDCVFTNNFAPGWGGGLLSGGRLDLETCEFSGNYASTGGAIYNWGSLSLRGSAFTGNNAVAGGALANAYGEAHLRQCRLERNYARTGGAIWNAAGVLKVINSLLENNRAGFGGAIAHDDGTLTLVNCTLVANSASALGGGVITGVGTTILNSILWGNRTGPADDPFTDELAQIEGGRFSGIDYSCIQGWTGLLGGVGNIGDDPLFVQPNDPDGTRGPAVPDLRLSAESPLINAGDPDFVAYAGEGDLDGHARVLCGRVDLGAYEFGIGDFNCDRVAGLDDFAAWADCMFGPFSDGLPDGCEAFDFNADFDVDLQDYAGFQAAGLVRP